MLLGGRVVVPGGSVAGQGSGWSIVAPDQQGARLSYGFAHGLVLLPPDLTVAAAHAWFDTLAEDCAQAIASGLVLVAGDINARTAGRSESTDDAAQPRESVDTVINSHGRALLHFCCTTGLRMCNGDVVGDRPARPTNRGRSAQANAVVDYYLACPRLIPLVRSLRASPVPPPDGDHCPLRLDISVTAQQEDLAASRPPSRLHHRHCAPAPGGGIYVFRGSCG